MPRLAVLLLVAGAIAAAAAPAPSVAAPKPLVVAIAVDKKGVVGGSKRIAVTKGRRVAIVVRSALAGEIHIHGYELRRVVRAGGTARLAFTARLAGRFEIELHSRVPLLLGVLEVRP